MKEDMMNMEKTVLIIFLLLAFTTGYASNAVSCPGCNYDHSNGYDIENLTDEEKKAVENERNRHLEETGELRKRINEKDLELAKELSQKEPSAKKAIKLQKKISKLQSQLDLKRVEHILALKKINPEILGKAKTKTCPYKKEGTPKKGGCPFRKAI